MSQHASTTPLIPTGIRKKLQRGLRHPVGAEAISRALAGCQKFDDLTILFGDKPQALDVAPKACDGFSLAFSVYARNESQLGWRLIVPAVPSQSRHAVRQLLELAGLPAVREWLRPRPETWYTGVREFQVGYALEPPRVCFVESEVSPGWARRKRKLVASTVREVPSVRPAVRVTPAAANPDRTATSH